MRLLALKTVLVAADLDESSTAAIATAYTLATAADAELHVVHVAENGPPDGRGVHEILERAGVPLDGAAVHGVAGDPALAISRLADALPADVIVLGPHRQCEDCAPMTGTALGVVTKSAAPCLIAHDLRLPLTNVVVAVDLSETARGALVIGLSWASALRGGRGRNGVGVTALYVTNRDATAAELAALTASLERQVADLRDGAGTWANASIECQVVGGDDVPQAIARYAQEHVAGLLVLGTRGLDLDTAGRLGSVAASVAASTTIPTLLVPPAIWLELGRVRPRPRRRSIKRRATG